MEIARFTAWLVVGSFTDVGFPNEFHKLPWEDVEEKTVEEIDKMFEEGLSGKSS